MLEQAAIRSTIVGKAGTLQEQQRPDGINRVESFTLFSISLISSAVLQPTRVGAVSEDNKTHLLKKAVTRRGRTIFLTYRPVPSLWES